jgi:DNA-binding CsgD family transcriptional regulator
MTLNLSPKDVTLLKRVSESLLQPLAPDWLLTTPDLTSDLLRLLSMDFIGTTRWNPRTGRYGNAMCAGRGPEMARSFVEEFQRCDPISPRLRHRRGPTPIYSVIRRDELERTRYFNEFLRVYQTVDGIDLHLYDGDTNVGDFRFWRAHGRVPIGTRQATLLQLLQPVLLHVTRSVHHGEPTPERDGASCLTVREGQIAAGVVGGMTDRAIARSLGISYWTVRSHLEHIFEKLGVANRTALVTALHRRAPGERAIAGREACGRPVM